MPTPTPSTTDSHRARQVAAYLDGLTRAGRIRRIVANFSDLWRYLHGRPSLREQFERELAIALAVHRRLGEIEGERIGRNADRLTAEAACPGAIEVDLDVLVQRAGVTVFSCSASLRADADDEGLVDNVSGALADLLPHDVTANLVLRELEERERDDAAERAAYRAESAECGEAA